MLCPVIHIRQYVIFCFHEVILSYDFQLLIMILYCVLRTNIASYGLYCAAWYYIASYDLILHLVIHFAQYEFISYLVKYNFLVSFKIAPYDSYCNMILYL